MIEPTVSEAPAAVAVTLPALAIARVFKRKVPPTALPKVTVPVPATKLKLRVSFASPSRVLVKEMLPPLVEKVRDPVSVSAVGKVRLLFTVVKFPPTDIPPVGVKVMELAEILLGRVRTPVNETEANSPLPANPIVPGCIVPGAPIPVPAFKASVLKLLAPAWMSAVVILPPVMPLTELIVRFVLAASCIVPVVNVIGWPLEKIDVAAPAFILKLVSAA